MPTTPVYGLRYPAQTDPADVPTDMGELATDVETALTGAVGTGRYRGALTPAAFAALTGVADGDTCDLIVDATLGVVWRLRYRAASASTFKWEMLGGASLGAETTAEMQTGSAAYVVAGPQVVVPRAGEYEIDLWGSGRFDGGWGGWLAAKLGAAAASDLDAVSAQWGAAGTATVGMGVARKLPVRTLAANNAVELWAKTNGGATARWSNRGVAVRPVRVSQA